VAHGRGDPVIPIALAHRAKKLLEESTARLEYREYDMAHEITQKSLRDSAAFLTRLVGGTERG
jgi:predicted esterase